MNFENGRFRVIARATDRGGNIAEDSGLYTIRNTVLQRAGAEQKIMDANAERGSLMGYIEALRAKNIDVNAFSGALAAADSNLTDAGGLYSQGLYFELASQAADRAKSAYSSARSRVSTSVYSSATYSYAAADLGSKLASAGIPERMRQDAEASTLALATSRKLEILKVTSGAETYYVANMVLAASNNDRNAVSFILVELVPKQFADDAADLNSAAPFEVLNWDPVLSFGPFDLNFGEREEFSYGIAARLTKAQADALVSGVVFNYYTSPPIGLPDGSDVSPLRALRLLPGIPDVEVKKENVLLVAAAGFFVFGGFFLLLLLGAASAYYFFVVKKKK